MVEARLMKIREEEKYGSTKYAAHQPDDCGGGSGVDVLYGNFDGNLNERNFPSFNEGVSRPPQHGSVGDRRILIDGCLSNVNVGLPTGSCLPPRQSYLAAVT